MYPKSLYILLLLQILTLHLFILFSRSVQFSGNLTDIQSLLAFKSEITDDPFGVLHSWNQSLHFCQWSGVRCGRPHQRVVRLDLSSSKLQGSLSLEAFTIISNKFSGQFPVSISNASHLYHLELSSNSFTGKIPIMTGLHNLKSLLLFSNDFGNGEADDLSFLDPLANTTSLELLELTDNNFGGELPQIVRNFSTNLRHMGFGGNQIRGSIPKETGNIISLQRLGFQVNQLTGFIPTSIGKLQKLYIWTIHGNEIFGTIPSSLQNMTSLTVLDLGTNKLEGRIPPSLGNCQNLFELYLGDSKFSGPIPEEVLGIPSLAVYLDFYRNELTGPLPMQVGRLVHQGILDTSDNKLSGEIPSALASCVSLESLSLGGNFFQGTISMALISLKAIQHLNFSHNNLTGQIPKFWGEFKLLDSLDLSLNGLEGEVPVNGVFENASRISIIGNKNLCGGIPQLNLPKCPSVESNKPKSSTNRLLIVAIVCGCLGVIFMISFLLLCFFRKTSNRLPSGSSLEKSLLRVTYGDLHQATNGFSSSNLIGAGSFGSVYKGILNSNGRIMAVKVLNLLHKGALKSFMAEFKVWTCIRHRNLVKILTACSSIDFQGNDFKALIYEFMVNGSLDEWLHPVHSLDETRESGNLNLIQRLSIAVDIATALDYLHHQGQVPIIHCDLKPSNVLLDSDMTAHVGDFGITRFIQEVSDHSSQNQNSSIGLKGTIGYAAPEYGMGSEVPTYGDVYSFGILLLEMLTGRRPTDDIFKDGMNVHNFAESALPDCMVDVIDPILLNEHAEASALAATSRMRNQFDAEKYMECVSSVVKIGLACSAELPRDRMDINIATAELHCIRNILLGMHGRREITFLP